KSEMQRVESQLTEHGLADKVSVVEGGDTRQDSVRKALKALPAANDEDIVLVHDAVRPLIDAATIERTIESVEIHHAAIVAVPAVDTIKQVERTVDGALISSTIPRERIVLAQTPQGFRLGCFDKPWRPRNWMALSVLTKLHLSNAWESMLQSFPDRRATSRSRSQEIWRWPSSTSARAESQPAPRKSRVSCLMKACIFFAVKKLPSTPRKIAIQHMMRIGYGWDSH